MELDHLAKQTQGKLDLSLEPADQLRFVARLAGVVSPRGSLVTLVNQLLTDVNHQNASLIAVTAYTEIVDQGGESPHLELAKLSQFGSYKYSKHPKSPHSWLTLPPTAFVHSIARHADAYLRDGEHTEEISADCTSADPEHRGMTYHGSHITAVLWSAIRLMWHLEQEEEAP